MSEPPSIISSLRQTLQSLHATPYPTLANPPNCPRRASVALILRIRPSYAQPATTTETPIDEESTYAKKVETFFSQSWVQSGTAEILFIKRAARHGDRWTSHIALPGGKRDPDDVSDEATAERETSEEVGLDISSSSPRAILAGPLPQRVVTTDFGAVPLMVLCPFVYLLLDASPAATSLTLQPTEVASAHWIPISALLDPAARTYERAEIVDRFASRWGLLTRRFLSFSLGQALYGAIRLRPSESLYSPETPAQALLQFSTAKASLWSQTKEAFSEDIHSIMARWGFIGADPDPSRRLLLWGLTHGITCDFLGLLPVAKGIEWWRWPTLSKTDVRFVIWLVSHRFRKRKTTAVMSGDTGNLGAPVMIAEGFGVVSPPDSTDASTSEKQRLRPATIYSAAGFLLDGYFQQIQRAVYIVLVMRLLLGSAGGWYLWKRYNARR